MVTPTTPPEPHNQDLSMSLSQSPGQLTDTPMQLGPIEHPMTVRLAEDEDEYSDFAEDPEEIEIIDRLLLEAAFKQNQDQNAPLIVTDIEDYEAPQGVRLPKVLGFENTRHWDVQVQSEQPQTRSNLLDQSAESRVKIDRDEGDQKTAKEQSAVRADQQDAQPPERDTRSPLLRFRKPPMKALSVTDLVSPSWCELQYYYVLTKHGRKRRTPAMKQGSAVHQALEDAVHVTVPVTVTKKEDSWGLRIWNIIQSLRTLRETGLTREMEIWGSVGGELVNGVIDELSYDCPDPKLEEQSLKLLSKQDAEPPLPEYQASIRDYLVSSEHREQGQSIADALRNGGGGGRGVHPVARRSQDDRRIYITDVKTRGTPTLPTGSATRPTILQLHLYHHMLENLAQGNFALSQLAERYKFDTHETFSDAFIAQVGSLNEEVFELASSQLDDETGRNGSEAEIVASTQDSMDILLQHNNVAALWEFMMEQFRLTFLVSSPNPTSRTADSTSTDIADAAPPSSTPQSLSQLPVPPSQPTRLSPLLTARYIATNYRRHHRGTRKSEEEEENEEEEEDDDVSAPRYLGTKSFIFNPSFLKSHLYETLGFWRGDRSPRGVEVHDAWKCRVCEFRDGCEWVQSRDEAALKEAVERRRLRREGTEMDVDAEADMEAGQPDDGHGHGDGGRRSRV